MHPSFLQKFIVFAVVIAACSMFCSAQTANTSPQNVEVVNENDSLPFMHNGEDAVIKEPSSGSLLIKTLGALVLIVGLIFVGAWGAKKLGFGGTKTTFAADAPELAILSSVSLGSGRTISTVRFGSRVLVVGSTAQSFTLLAEDKTDAELSFENSRSVSEMLDEENGMFADALDAANSRMDDFGLNGARS
ncbi:MAG: flagellar biosynthetic protein FliO [Acidobacteriota bacterium]